MLLGNGETELIRQANGRIPLTVASEIANGTSRDIQRALTEAYESGELRGAKLKTVRAIIRRRNAKRTEERKQKSAPKAPLTSQDLAKEYKEHTRIQRALVKRAAVVRERLALLGAACRQLFADPNFVTLLRAENLSVISEKLLELTREPEMSQPTIQISFRQRSRQSCLLNSSWHSKSLTLASWLRGHANTYVRP